MSEMDKIVTEVVRVLRENGAIPKMWSCKLCNTSGRIVYDHRHSGYRASCDNKYGCPGGPDETYGSYEAGIAGWNRWAKR